MNQRGSPEGSPSEEPQTARVRAQGEQTVSGLRRPGPAQDGQPTCLGGARHGESGGSEGLHYGVMETLDSVGNVYLLK